jgi:hypothetical protein
MYGWQTGAKGVAALPFIALQPYWETPCLRPHMYAKGHTINRSLVAGRTLSDETKGAKRISPTCLALEPAAKTVPPSSIPEAPVYMVFRR